MEGTEDLSWTPTLVGMMDELVLYIYSLCDAINIYYMAWTCRRFQRLAKTKSLKLSRRLQERAIIQLRKDNYIEALVRFGDIPTLFFFALTVKLINAFLPTIRLPSIAY
jgi:hypothetical protein